MTTYEQILKDKIIIAEYAKIDDLNFYPLSHGLRHIENVIENIKKMAVVFKLNSDTTRNLLIAAVLHDVGQTQGRTNHGYTSMEFAKKYLAGKVSEEDLAIILQAIENHDQSTSFTDLTLFDVLLCFADKMDFTAERFVPGFKEQWGHVGHIVYEDITAVDFDINEAELQIKITSNGALEVENLLNEPIFFHKIIDAIKTLAEKFRVMPKVLVDGKTLSPSVSTKIIKPTSL